MPNVAWPWQNIGPTYTRARVSEPTMGAREPTASHRFVCVYIAYIHLKYARADWYARHGVP